MGSWHCDWCDTSGEVPAGHTSDHVLCDVCGEPVEPER